MAGGGDVVDDDIARLARAREFELAPRAPPLAGGADLTCYRHIVHLKSIPFDSSTARKLSP